MNEIWVVVSPGGGFGECRGGTFIDLMKINIIKFLVPFTVINLDNKYFVYY